MVQTRSRNTEYDFGGDGYEDLDDEELESSFEQITEKCNEIAVTVDELERTVNLDAYSELAEQIKADPSPLSQYISEAKSAATNTKNDISNYTADTAATDIKEICGGCKYHVVEGELGIQCNLCSYWFHKSCQNISDDLYHELENSDVEWQCPKCSSEESAPLINIQWGSLNNSHEIRSKIDEIYEEIISWKKNIFLLPRGRVGREFLIELTRLINLFNYSTKWKDVALSLVHIFVPIRPCFFSHAISHDTKFPEKVVFSYKRTIFWNYCFKLSEIKYFMLNDMLN